MVTLEARAAGLARLIRAEVGACRRILGTAGPWMIVNDVAGFIGPEVFATAEQLERACLEDTVMAKLHGITMGLDVCATFHMGIAPMALRRLSARIVERAAPAYLMAVAGNADPMLGYLTTSFREHPRLRRQVGRRMTSAMEHRLTGLGVLGRDGEPVQGRGAAARLYAQYARAGGDARTSSSLQKEGLRRVHELRERGFDLGVIEPSKADARLEAIYTHARGALYATLDEGVIQDATAGPMRVRTTAADRDDYLLHPPAGERLRDDDARAATSLYPAQPPQVQLVISDGLNANGVNEQLRRLLPPLRRLLAAGGCHVGDAEIIVRNGRVRAGYEIGGLGGALIVIPVIGGRPGTGLNTASADFTYGRDQAGPGPLGRRLDHFATN